MAAIHIFQQRAFTVTKFNDNLVDSLLFLALFCIMDITHLYYFFIHILLTWVLSTVFGHFFYAVALLSDALVFSATPQRVEEVTLFCL